MQQLEQDGGRNVVGEITHNADGKSLVAEQIVNVHIEEVAFDDTHCGRQLLAEVRSEVPVDFYGHDALNAARQGSRERAPARANLQEHVVSSRGQRLEEFCHPGGLEKVLAESLSSTRNHGHARPSSSS